VSALPYIEHLQKAIKKTFGLDSKHVETLEVVESFRGQILFDGDVEVFDVTGHPDAKRCYAWAKDVETGSNSTVVLERPPIKNALDAVRAALVTAHKRATHN
jgi:hypothetical protein